MGLCQSKKDVTTTSVESTKIVPTPSLPPSTTLTKHQLDLLMDDDDHVGCSAMALFNGTGRDSDDCSSEYCSSISRTSSFDSVASLDHSNLIRQLSADKRLLESALVCSMLESFPALCADQSDKIQRPSAVVRSRTKASAASFSSSKPILQRQIVDESLRLL